MSSGGFKWQGNPSTIKTPKEWASVELGRLEKDKGVDMYLFRNEAHGLHGPGPAIGVAIAVFLFAFWSALQAGANLGVVVVNFFTTMPILFLGIAAIVIYCDAIPRWAWLAILCDLMWLLAYPVRHSVAERVRETADFGDLAWQSYLDVRVVDWGVFIILGVVAVLLFRGRR